MLTQHAERQEGVFGAYQDQDHVVKINSFYADRKAFLPAASAGSASLML